MVRIGTKEVEVIKKAVRDHFGSVSSVYLFGSRTDEKASGGDIDLLIESDMNVSEAVRARLDVMTDIQFGIGDQKIDIVVSRRGEEDDRGIVRSARRDGIEL